MNITIIGSGNVATHLTKALYEKGFIIDAVYSRDLQHSTTLAQQVKAKSYAIENEINCKADIIIISIPDDAIADIAFKLKNNTNSIILHTSGSVDISILKSHFNHYGVLYPLQTFSSDRQVDFAQIPLCLETSDDHTQTIVESIANKLSPSNIHHINSTQRRQLHLAAVFACNFTNAMYTIASEIVKPLSFDLLKPLILETAQKATTTNAPATLQTGPAKRKDNATITNHQTMLSQTPEYQELYTLISKIISQL